METKTVYHYDSAGNYVNDLTLDSTDKDPRGLWNIPGNCTDIAPILQDGYIPTWDGSTWIQIKVIVDVLCYYNNGLSVKTVKSNYLVADGEVLFTTTPTTEQLEAAFTDYSTAALAKAKLSKLAELYQLFSTDRDATTWVIQADGTKYGYDRKTDDVVTFLAAMKRAELGQETYYKVYINDINTKQMVLHTADMFHTCLGQSANEQITAYTKFDTAKAKVQAATTIDAVNAVTYSTDIPA